MRVSRILVVCIGNICRSPMAERLLATQLAHVEVKSAGLGALVGHPADALAIELMREQDIDLTDHRARQLDDSLIAWADLILVMSNGQKDQLCLQWPAARGMVFRIGHWGGEDVPDPYRLPRAAFEHALRLIEAGIGQWAPRLTPRR